MAIFELDDGRGTLVQPMRPSADSFDADSSSLVDDHVTALLGERVFPVRRGGDGTGPHLLALDAASQPVVVEVVQLLDSDALVRALRHAGGAGRLSRSDLSRMYHGGPDAFEADLAVFRDRAPIVRSQSADRGGVRLVLVCAEVEDSLADAVDFVAAGTQVEVLRLGVAEGPGGRRYLDVSPLRPTRSRERRPVEPGPRTGPVAVPASSPSPSAPTTAPTPVVPETARVDGVSAADETTLLPALDAEDSPCPARPSPGTTTSRYRNWRRLPRPGRELSSWCGCGCAGASG